MHIGTETIQAQEIITALEKAKTLILATCADHRVTIRPMSHVNDGLNVYFQTGRDYLKMQQIRINPNVALCVGDYEIEGVATVVGHPMDEANRFFAEKMQEKHPGAFARYASLAEEVVVKVKITLVRVWRYVDGKPVIAVGNFGGMA